MNSHIWNDKWKIKELYWINGGLLSVGNRDGVTKIEAYSEDGQIAEVHWFKIWKGDFLWQRLNGATVDGVVYQEESPR